MKNLRNDLFSGWAGCSNGDCVVRDNSKGMHTNGSCKCVVDANRAQLYMLQSRINRLIQKSAPLVRLTDEEIENEYCKADAYLMMTDHYEFGLVANSIMTAMIEKNKGKI